MGAIWRPALLREGRAGLAGDGALGFGGSTGQAGGAAKSGEGGAMAAKGQATLSKEIDCAWRHCGPMSTWSVGMARRTFSASISALAALSSERRRRANAPSAPRAMSAKAAKVTVIMNAMRRLYWSENAFYAVPRCLAIAGDGPWSQSPGVVEPKTAGSGRSATCPRHDRMAKPRALSAEPSATLWRDALGAGLEGEDLPRSLSYRAGSARRRWSISWTGAFGGSTSCPCGEGATKADAASRLSFEQA